MSSWFKSGLAALVSISLLACDKDKEVVTESDGYQGLYQETLKDFNSQVAKYNAMLDANYDTSVELWGTQLLVAIMDSNAQILKNEIAAIEASTLQTLLSGESCSEDIIKERTQSLDARTTEAIASIQALENQIGKKNLGQLIENAQLNIKPEFRDAKIAEYRSVSASSLKQFKGLRDLFLMSTYSVKQRINDLCKADVAKFDTEDYRPEVAVPVAEGSGQATGTVYAQNGTDPVVETLVYVPVLGNEWINDSGVGAKLPSSQGALSCGEPQEAYITKTCSDGKGAFRLEGLPTGTVILKMSKGLYSKRFAVAVTNGQTTTITQGETTLPKIAAEGAEVANIAIIQGSYDHLEKVLEKIGLKNEDGTKNYSVHSQSAGLELLSNPEALSKVDMLMINCGVDSLESQILENEKLRLGLKNWVEAGGRLFVTDQAYDFVEQLFASAIEFRFDAEGKSPMNRAQNGAAGAVYEAEIGKIGLQTWLEDGVRCNVNQSCLLPSRKVKIEGFAGGWAQMESVGAGTNVWVKSDERPLTVTFDAGQGRVFYSSYHTNHDGGSEIYPQERILQYFVFDLVD